MEAQVYITTLDDTSLLADKINQAKSNLENHGFEVKLWLTEPDTDDDPKALIGDVFNFDLYHLNDDFDLNEIYALVSKVLENVEIIALSIVVVPDHNGGCFSTENYNREYIVSLLQKKQRPTCKRR